MIAAPHGNLSPPLASLQGSSISTVSLAGKKTFNKEELEYLWAAVNPGLGNPHLMAAIALAESGGKAYEVNSIGACGLWQIHPFESGCTDPVTNAHQAGAKLRSQGLGAWVTYKEGQYKGFLGGSQLSPQQEGEAKNIVYVPGLGQVGPKLPYEGYYNPLKIAEPLEKATTGLFGNLGGFVTTFKDLVEIFKFFASPEGWVRLIKIFGGAILIGIAVIEMAKVGTGGEANVIPNAASAAAGQIKFPPIPVE